MTYEEAYLYMKEAGKRGSVYGTETVKELLLRLGNPQDRVPVVHIAGTNGKGSVCTMLASILQLEKHYLQASYYFSFHYLLHVKK